MFPLSSWEITFTEVSERPDSISPADALNNIADALGVTLDHLLGETSQVPFDKRTLTELRIWKNLKKVRNKHFTILLILT